MQKQRCADYVAIKIQDLQDVTLFIFSAPITDLAKVFDLVDTDKDGIITKKEYDALGSRFDDDGKNAVCACNFSWNIIQKSFRLCVPATEPKLLWFYTRSVAHSDSVSEPVTDSVKTVLTLTLHQQGFIK